MCHHLAEELRAPDVEFRPVHHVGLHIRPRVLEVDGVDSRIERGDDLLRRRDVRLWRAFLGSFDKMRQVERHVLCDVPGDIVPVAALDPALPLPEERGGHLAGEQVWQRVGASPECSGRGDGLHLGREVRRLERAAVDVGQVETGARLVGDRVREAGAGKVHRRCVLIAVLLIEVVAVLVVTEVVDVLLVLSLLGVVAGEVELVVLVVEPVVEVVIVCHLLAFR